MSEIKSTPEIERSKQPAPPDPEELAEAIKRISAAVARLQKSGLNEKAIIVLLHDSSGVTKKNIKYVLDHLAYLPQVYCRK